MKELYSNTCSITLDDLLALKPLLPLPEEKSIFQLAANTQKCNTGSPAESFMIATSSAPALNWVVDAMIMQRQFDSECSEIIRLLSLLKNALLVLKKSSTIKLLMKNILDGCQLATLEFGRSKSQKQQILMRGATKGVRISSLSRLSAFRSDSGQKTLLHFIAESLNDSSIAELKKIRSLVSEIRGTDSTFLRESIRELNLSIEKIKEGPDTGESGEMVSQFLAAINIWAAEKSQKLTDLWDLFENFNTLWEEVAVYFGEQCFLNSSTEFEAPPNIQNITLEEFFKQWDDFLKELLDAHFHLELEKWHPSAQRSSGHYGDQQSLYKML